MLALVSTSERSRLTKSPVLAFRDTVSPGDVNVLPDPDETKSRLPRLLQAWWPPLRERAARLWGRPEFRFPISFFAVSCLLFALKAWFLDATDWLPLRTTEIVVSSARMTGLKATSTDAVATFAFSAMSPFSYVVDDGCTGLTPFLLFCSAVLAFPATWRQRILGLLVGLPALFALNIVRLVSMAWIGLYDEHLFHQVHVLWWQAIFIAAVGVAWFAWIRLCVVRSSSPGRRAGFKEVALDVGIFLAAACTLLLAGRLLHVQHAYAVVVKETVNLVLGMFGLPTWRFRDGSAWSSPNALFTWMAIVLAFFAATPRLSWRARLMGALGGLGLVFTVQVASNVFGEMLAIGGGARSVFLRTMVTAGLHVVVPICAWYPWARSHWSTDRSPNRTMSGSVGPHEARL